MIPLTLALVVVAVAIQFYDRWSTIKILQAGGLELNPIMRWIISKIGLVPAITGKAVVVSGLYVYAGYLALTGACPVEYVAGGLAVALVAHLIVFCRHNFKHDGL